MENNYYNPKKTKFGKAKTIQEIKNNIKDIISGVTGLSNVNLDTNIYIIPTTFENHETELTIRVFLLK